MFLHIDDFELIEGYLLRLVFDNGSVREVNLELELYGEIFEPLRDLRLFRQLYINPETKTIEWPNGADFAPEFLYDLGTDVSFAGQFHGEREMVLATS